MTFTKPLCATVIPPSQDWMHDRLINFVALLKLDGLTRTPVTITGFGMHYVAANEFGKVAVKWHGARRHGVKYGNGELILRGNEIEISMLPMSEEKE
jgi:hypothetical protein